MPREYIYQDKPKFLRHDPENPNRMATTRKGSVYNTLLKRNEEPQINDLPTELPQKIEYNPEPYPIDTSTFSKRDVEIMTKLGMSYDDIINLLNSGQSLEDILKKAGY